MSVRKEIEGKKGKYPYFKDSWLEDMGAMTARENADTYKGLFLAAKGGHNSVSHNHNDVGTFIVYSDGEPVFVDAGIEDYTAKTFGKERYNLWTMQSAYHNLPTVNGVMQKYGKEYQAIDVNYSVTADTVQFSMDIAKAYPEIPQVVAIGYFGDLTEKSVLAFQKKFGLPTDGVVGAETWNKITSEYQKIKSSVIKA
jgi:hypothetical protein